MKIQDEWKERLHEQGIHFEFRTLKGKYPHEAAIIFPGHREISLRGRRVGKELQLITCDPSIFERCIEDNLKQFSHLIYFFQAFAKNKGIDNLVLRDDFFNTLPHNIIVSLTNACNLTYFPKRIVEKMNQHNLIHLDKTCWYMEVNDTLIARFLKFREELQLFFQEKEKQELTFIPPKQTDYAQSFESLRFHYLGHNGAIFLSLTNEHQILLEEKSLSISHTVDESSLLDHFFNELTSKLKVKSLFSTNTYFLDNLLSRINAYRSVRNEMKNILLARYAVPELEKKAAQQVKYSTIKNPNESAIHFVILTDFAFVYDHDHVLFYSQNEEEAFDYFSNLIISTLEQSLNGKKEKLQAIKNTLFTPFHSIE